MNPPVFTDLDAGCDHDFPGMIVGICKISGVTAIVGLVSWPQQRGPLGNREIQHRIDLLGRGAIPGERGSTKGLWPRLVRKRDVLRQLIPREQPDHGPACIKESNRLSGRAYLSRKTQCFIKRDTGAHVADAERNDRKARNWWFLTHATSYPTLHPSLRGA